MLRYVASYLVFALRYISRVGIMPQQPMLNPLPEILEKDDFITVKLWKDISVKGYLESETSRECKVVGIKRFKNNRRSQHEYLVAVLQCQSGCTRYVRIERNVQSTDEYGAPMLSPKQHSDADSAPVTPGREIMMPMGGNSSSFVSPMEEYGLVDPQPPPQPNRIGSISASISKIGQAQDIVSYWEPPCYDLEDLSLSGLSISLRCAKRIASSVDRRITNERAQSCYSRASKFRVNQ